MHKYLMPRALPLALIAALLAAGSAAAQGGTEPAATPPPDCPLGNRLVSAVATGGLEDPRAADAVASAARAAHDDLCGVERRFLRATFERPADAAPLLSSLTESEEGQAPNVAVIFGGDNQGTVGEALNNGSTIYFDVDQPIPCVTEGGRPDPSGTCAGGTLGLPFNYSALTFAVDEAAYLAGIVAAGASRNGRLGVISGLPGCEACDRAIEGFTLGAQSLRPSATVEVAYLADDDEDAAYRDLATARAFAEAFIEVYEPEVIMPLAGASSRGIIEAACDAGVLVVGSDTDISVTYPNLSQCVLTSVVKDFDKAVREAVFGFSDTVLPQRVMDLANGGVDVRAGSEAWTPQPNLPVDLSSRVDAARQAILAGAVETCPTACPQDAPSSEEDDPDASDGPDDDDPDDEGSGGGLTSDDIED